MEVSGGIFFYNGVEWGDSYFNGVIHMRILLADDQTEVRSALKIMLGQEPGLDVVDEVGELASLLVKARESVPDLVLLDWELSNIRVSDMVPLLRRLCPGMKIIALSGRPEASSSAMAAGVDAFVSKGDQPEKLLEAIQRMEK